MLTVGDTELHKGEDHYRAPNVFLYPRSVASFRIRSVSNATGVENRGQIFIHPSLSIKIKEMMGEMLSKFQV